MGPWNVGPWVPEIRDSSVLLTCQHHPDLCWNQKNLGYLGARSIFFFGWLIDNQWQHSMLHPTTGEFARECDCPGTDLLIVYGDYRLDLSMCGPRLPQASAYTQDQHAHADWVSAEELQWEQDMEARHR